MTLAAPKLVDTTCLGGCGKVWQVCEEIAGCCYCEDCPFPLDPCETCGLQNPPEDHDCCTCRYCVARRAAKKETPC